MIELRRQPVLPVDPALLTRTLPLSRCLQLDNRGCVLACIAILAGKHYEQISELAEAMGWLAEIRRVGTHRDKQHALLAMVRVRTGYLVSCRQWRKVRQLALVTVRYSAFGTLHSVVYDPVAGGVLDPSPDVTVEVRRDWGNLPMVHYVPVLQLPSDSTGPRPFRKHVLTGLPKHNNGEADTN